MTAENGVMEIIQGIQADLAAVDSRVREHFAALDRRVSDLHADMSGLKADMAGIKHDMAGIKTDMHSHSDTLNVLLQDVREIRAAVNDMGSTRVTAGEIGALHHDVTRVQRGLSDPTARV